MLEEVGEFAALYANDPRERTSSRDAAITRAAEKYLKKVKTCSCPDWHLDTLFELMRIINQLKMSDYLMPAGAVLYLFSRSDVTTTVHNLDNDLAELHLGLDSRNLDKFEEYPKDKKGNWAGITEARFAELCEQFNVDPSIRVEESQPFNAPIKLSKAEQAKADKLALAEQATKDAEEQALKDAEEQALKDDEEQAAKDAEDQAAKDAEDSLM